MNRAETRRGGDCRRPVHSTELHRRLYRVMLQILQNEIDSSSFEQLQEHHAELRRLTLADVQRFITTERIGR